MADNPANKIEKLTQTHVPRGVSGEVAHSLGLEHPQSESQIQNLTETTQSYDVVELEGEDARVEWEDAIDEQEFADSVMFAIDCLIAEEPTATLDGIEVIENPED